MEPYFKRAKSVTLLTSFNRRLAFLFGAFSLVTSVLIVIFYQSFTDNLNTKDLNETLQHLDPRIRSIDQSREENADHLLSIIDWSGIARMNEPLRTQKLNAFFIAQSENLGFEGVLITDAKNGNLLFNYWAHTETPHFQAALAGEQPLWVDEEHSVLYSRIKKTLSGPNMGFNVFLFKAWDSEVLKRISFPTTTTYISLGSHPLLSSAGNLSLEAIQPASSEYVHFNINDIPYQEGSFEWRKVTLLNGTDLPLRIIVRAPVTNSIPLHEVLAASLSLTLLFGLLIFLIFGRWLKQIGLRLNALTGAVAHYQEGQDVVVK
jgi:hypothetical protein